LARNVVAYARGPKSSSRRSKRSSGPPQEPTSAAAGSAAAADVSGLLQALVQLASRSTIMLGSYQAYVSNDCLSDWHRVASVVRPARVIGGRGPRHATVSICPHPPCSDPLRTSAACRRPSLSMFNSQSTLPITGTDQAHSYACTTRCHASHATLASTSRPFVNPHTHVFAGNPRVS
jgi:hypothetical protein